jgi:hypothetical protein
MAFTTGQAGGQVQPIANVPAQYTGDAQELARSQRLAQMLSSAPMPEGQMVSGRFVAPSWTQQLAGLVNAGTGAYFANKSENQQQELAKKLRQGEATAMADYMEQRRTNPELANTNLYMNPVASAAQKDLAFKRMTEGPMKLGAEETLVDPFNFKPVATGGEKTAPDVRTAAQMLGIRGNPETWNTQQTQAVANQVIAMKKAGAPSVSVSTANKFAGGFAGKASEGAYGMYEQALAAPTAIENAKRTIELINSGAMTGPTANIGLEAAKIFNVAGANNQDTISKTEQLFSNRGKAMLGSIKQSGLAGSQGLTEGERKFLTQAEGGTITLNAETLKAMAGLEIKMAVQNQKRWNQQAGKMDPEILRATGAGPVEVYTGIGTIDATNPLLAPKK